MTIGLNSTSLGELKSIPAAVFTEACGCAYLFPAQCSALAAAHQGRYMQQPQSVSLTLVIGGVRSGKSGYAQQLAARAKRVTFIATAERRDDAEMQAKISRHRAERPATWSTIEEPLELHRAIQAAGLSSDVLLIDCLTLFAANLLETFGRDEARIELQIDALCQALSLAPCPVVLVSNEVGSGVVPAYELGRRFRDLVGEINQRIAAIATTVLLMVAGLPFAVKGAVPAEVAS